MKIMKKQITIDEVAKRAGVSKATVSRAINNSSRVKTATLKQIKRIINVLGYHPNTAARGIRTKVSKTIGIILPDISNNFYATLVRGIEDQARISGYQIMITNTDEITNNEYAEINNLLNQMIDGLIIVSTGGIKDYQQILRKVPILFVDRTPNTQEYKDYDVLTLDNQMGSYQAVTQLIHEGAERIGFINTSVPDIDSARLQGYKQALKDNHIKIDPDIIKQSDRRVKTVQKLTGQLVINQACDSLFAANNSIFYQVLKKVKDAKIKDLKLATFDDNYLYQFLNLNRRLTVIKQPAYKMGHDAVIHLINRINNPDLRIQHIKVKPQLKIYY